MRRSFPGRPSFLPALLLLAAVAPPVLAEGTGVPCRVVVEGNKRTKKNVILEAADLLEVKEKTVIDPEQIETKVRNTRLFSEVDTLFYPMDDPPTLYIRIQDKWTLTPVPFVSSYEGESKVGLDLVEYNLFGLGKTLLIGGVLATRGYNLQSHFIDPAVFLSPFSAAVKASFRKYTYREYDDDDVIQDYHDEFWFVDLESGMDVTKELRIGLKLTFRRDRIIKEDLEIPARSGWGNSMSAWGTYDITIYHYFFSEGVKARVDINWIDPAFGANTRAFSVTAVGLYTMALPQNHCLSLFFYGGISETRDARFVFKIGGTEGTRGLNAQGLWARQYGSAGIQYQIPFWQVILDQKVFGTCALTGYCEIGAASRVQGDTAKFSVLGVGFRFYLRGFSIPTIAVDLLYDPQKGTFSPGIGVGTNW